MRTYLLSIDIDNIERGKVYATLPLHCTLMPFFNTRLGPDDIVLQLGAALKDVVYITLVSDAPALFGPNNDVPVHTIQDNEELINIHKRIIWILSKLWDVTFPETAQWAGAYYRPHVTTVGNRSFPTGSVHHAEYVTLFERIVTGGVRELHAAARMRL